MHIIEGTIIAWRHSVVYTPLADKASKWRSLTYLLLKSKLQKTIAAAYPEIKK